VDGEVQEGREVEVRRDMEMEMEMTMPVPARGDVHNCKGSSEEGQETLLLGRPLDGRRGMGMEMGDRDLLGFGAGAGAVRILRRGYWKVDQGAR
jgi:hypothetical protein